MKKSTRIFLSSTTFLVIGLTTLVSSAVFAQDTSIISPVNGSTVTSPVTVDATTSGCDSQSSTAFGWSIDSLDDTVISSSDTSIDTTTTLATGSHTIHFKTWNGSGDVCVVNTTFTVTANLIPPDAKQWTGLNGLNDWLDVHDTGTSGTASGATTYPIDTPSLNNDDTAREFSDKFTDGGGMRASVVFAQNQTAVTHVVYDTYVYVPSSTQSSVANVEMDVNQVLTVNGQTMTQIYAFQCDGYKNTWDYSKIVSNQAIWEPTPVACNPRNWTPDTWHHVQIASHRDDEGDVTYDWVSFDGQISDLNITEYEAYLATPAWTFGILQINFQIDGDGSGSTTVYSDKLSVWTW
jgi:hypothetical protein